MKTLKIKPVMTLAAACVLSMLSAGSFAGGMRSAPTATPAPATRPAASATAPASGASTPMRSARSAATTHRTGQPNASCESTPNPPGNSASAPGSAFNPDGKSGTVYAGEQPQNSRNPKSVSQYDVACTRRAH